MHLIVVNNGNAVGLGRQGDDEVQTHRKHTVRIVRLSKGHHFHWDVVANGEFHAVANAPDLSLEKIVFLD